MVHPMSPAASEAMLLHRDILPHHLYKDDNKLSKDQKKALKDKGNRGALRGGSEMGKERVRIEEYIAAETTHVMMAGMSQMWIQTAGTSLKVSTLSNFWGRSHGGGMA
jgi:hypothetical protein